MLLKIVGSALIISSAFLIGNSKSRKLYKRHDFLKSFIVFLNSLSTAIRYETMDIFLTISSCIRDENLSYISIKENTQPFDKQWQKQILSLPSSLSLKKSDIELLIEFGNELGKTDIEGQLKHIDLYKTLFNKELISAEEEILNKSKLYKIMGLFVGISTTLMII